MIILDLLFKNKRHGKLTEIVLDVIESKKLNFPQSWFYEIAIISAFRLVRAFICSYLSVESNNKITFSQITPLMRFRSGVLFTTHIWVRH